MNKHQLKKTLKTEIRKINKVIDQKIMRNQVYDLEARYHKMLVARLNVLNRTTMIARSMRLASLMMF